MGTIAVAQLNKAGRRTVRTWPAVSPIGIVACSSECSSLVDVRSRGFVGKMDSDKSLGLMTFQEMFSGPAEKEQQTFKKIKQLKGSKETSGKNELLRVLRNQRVHIDQNAIHFVASPRAGPRADARNSVFKLSQRYQQLPDRENVSRIRQMFQKVKEEEDSGDDEWAPKYGKVPDVLKGQAAAKMLDEPSPEHLMAEVQNIGDEAQTAPQGVLTQEEIDDQQVVDDFVDTANARRRASVDRKEAADAAAASAPAEEEDDSDDEDEDDGAVHFDDTDLSGEESLLFGCVVGPGSFESEAGFGGDDDYVESMQCAHEELQPCHEARSPASKYLFVSL